MADDKQKPLSEKTSGKAAPFSEGNEYEKICGIIRPISPMDYPERHWEEVHKILAEAITEMGLEARLVSDTAEISIIQKTIIQSLYNCPIIICDISGKNPNVMFELGLRLAFDKPTIIVKDEKTDYSFDISVIEHLPYPSSLHYWDIKKFEKAIKAKLTGTLNKARGDKAYSPFLKNFDRLVPAKLGEKQLPEMEYIQGMFNEIGKSIASLASKLEHYETQQQNDNVLREAWPMFVKHRGGQGRFGQRLMKRHDLLRQLERERENLKNVNSAQMASEVARKIERLENALSRLEIDDL